MKKTLAVILASFMTVFAFAACGNGAGTKTSSPATEAPKSEASAKTETAGGDALKTGLAVVISGANSKEADKKIVSDATVAAVLVDKDGKIVDCALDGVQSTFQFEGSEIATAPDTKFESRDTIGANYGMKKTSKIGKEWNEQAAAFAKYCVGKTSDAIKGIKLNAGIPSDTDLASSVTIHVGDFQKAICAAVENAQELGAKKGDKLGLGAKGAATQTKQKADDKGNATAVAYNYYTATSFDASQKVTSAIYDASQAKYEVKDGKIVTDINTAFESKDVLKDKYGMKKASKIGKEWFEQAASFAKFTDGKTVDQIVGMKLTDAKAPAEADLASSVTVHVTDFFDVLQLAAKNAK